MRKSAAIISGISLVLVFISISCVSMETANYAYTQANPFLNTRHTRYALFSKLENDTRNIYFGLQYFRNELSYLKNDSGYTAELNVQMRLSRDELETAWDTIFTIKKFYSTYDSTRINISEKFYVPLRVPPGEYEFFCSLSEKQSSDDVRINTEITVPEDKDSFMIAGIRILENRHTGDISLTKQIPRNNIHNSSVDFDIIYRHPGQVRLQLVLTKIKSDTSMARSFYSMTPYLGSLEIRGYKREDPEWENFVIDTLIAPGEMKTFSYPLNDTTKEGVYTAVVKLSAGGEELVFPGETFFVFPEYFPEIKTLDEAVEIVGYLARYGDFRKIYDSPNDSVKKEYFDKFWLDMSGDNPVEAKRKISLFYQRAAEANLMFSSYKPGWKTDLGMTYILFGRPDQTTWRPSSLTWYYYSDRYSANIPMEFSPIRDYNKIIGYYLVRHPIYELLWYQYRRKWETYY